MSLTSDMCHHTALLYHLGEQREQVALIFKINISYCKNQLNKPVEGRQAWKKAKIRINKLYKLVKTGKKRQKGLN